MVGSLCSTLPPTDPQCLMEGKGLRGAIRRCGCKLLWLEALVSSQSYDIIGVTEIWRNESHNWNAGMEVYRLFRKDRQGW